LFRYFFILKQQWAGRSVWYDRRVRNAEAAGSNPARSTFTTARPLFESPQTLEVILDLKKQGKAEETINGYSRRLRHLAKNTDINDPETVKEYISNKKSSNANKEGYANAYNSKNQTKQSPEHST
jgi:hypothetical protein